MPKLQFTCGVDDGPVAGSTIFTAKFLKTCLVNFIIVNNAVENQQEPTPDFNHSYVSGKISRGTNIWQVADKLIIDYTPCKNCD